MKLIRKYQKGKNITLTNGKQIPLYNLQGSKSLGLGLWSKDGNTYVNTDNQDPTMAGTTIYSAKDKEGNPVRDTNNKLITGKTQEEAQQNFNNALRDNSDLRYKYMTPSKGVGTITHSDINNNIINPAFQTMGEVYENTIGKVPVVSDLMNFTGDVLSIPQWMGFLRSGKAPWNPENRGFNEYDMFNMNDSGDILNNYGNIISIPKGFSILSRTKGIVSNLTPKRFREHVYASRVPFGYSNISESLSNLSKGILSGKQANTVFPEWLQKFYDSDPSQLMTVKNRDAAWRLYLGLPQDRLTPIPNKQNTYTISNKFGDEWSLTPTIEDVTRRDRKVKLGTHNTVDDVFKIQGGNTINSKYTGKNRKGENVGISVMTDYWDLQPFKNNPGILERLIDKNNEFLSGKQRKIRIYTNEFNRNKSKIQLGKKKLFDPSDFGLEEFQTYTPRKPNLKYYIYNTLDKGIDKFKVNTIPKFVYDFDNKFKNFEAGSLIGGKPFHTEFKIPWTETMIEVPRSRVKNQYKYEFRNKKGE